MSATIINPKGIGRDDAEFTRAFAKMKAHILKAFSDTQDETVKSRIIRALEQKDLNAVTEAIPWNELNGHLKTLKMDIRDLYELEAGIAAASAGISFDVMNPRIVGWVSEYGANLVQQISQNTRLGIQEAVKDMFVAGKGTRYAADEIVKSIGLTEKQEKAVSNYRKALEKDGVGGDILDRKVQRYRVTKIKQRAETIARTETVNAAANSQELVWQEGITSGEIRPNVYEVRWNTSPNDACPICIAMNGQRRPIGGTYPGGQGPPTRHPQCLIGSTGIIASEIVALTKRRYEGPIITIKSASGNQLTCSPNHPILTLQGWIAADLLNKGDSIISSRFRNSLTGTHEQNKYTPPMIEEIAESFIHSGPASSKSVEVSAEDFHGDGIGSEIAIIYSDGHLRNSWDAPFCEHGFEYCFVAADSERANESRHRAMQHARSTLGSSDGCSMGSSNLRSTFACGHPRPFNRFGLGLIAGDDSMLSENAPDHIAGNRKAIGYEVFRFPRLVLADDFGLGKVGHGPSSRAELDLSLIQNSADHNFAAIEFGTKLSGTSPVEVFVDDVIGVDISSFSGHVFNCETVSGWYVANNIITHNCRCVESLVERKSATPQKDFYTNLNPFNPVKAENQRQVIQQPQKPSAPIRTTKKTPVVADRYSDTDKLISVQERDYGPGHKLPSKARSKAKGK